MSIPITFNGTTVNFPSSGEAPLWSPAIIQAMQLISQALSVSAGAFDIPPQIYVMTSNVNTDVAIPNLSFPTSNVSGAIIFYNCTRVTIGVGATEVSETGTIYVNYDPSQPITEKWQVSPEYTNDSAQITFSMDDTGQMKFSTTLITGSSHQGRLYYRALAVLTS